MKYDDNDYELLYLIKEENEDAKEAFYEKYLPIVEMKAKKYFDNIKGVGYDLNDLIQEGMIGLSSAIKDFEEHKDAKFSTFASVCIDRQLVNYIRDNNRQKHRVLNSSLSIDQTTSSGRKLIDILNDKSNPNPEESFVSIEEQEEFKEKIRQCLTPREREVFDLRYEGFTYQEIAMLLNISKKSVDGTITRIKQKITNMKKNID